MNILARTDWERVKPVDPRLATPFLSQPGVCSVLVNVSDPATSSRVGLRNDTDNPLQIEEKVSGREASQYTVPPHEAHWVSLENPGIGAEHNRFEVLWGVDKLKFVLRIDNAQGGHNFARFQGTMSD